MLCSTGTDDSFCFNNYFYPFAQTPWIKPIFYLIHSGEMKINPEILFRFFYGSFICFQCLLKSVKPSLPQLP